MIWAATATYLLLHFLAYVLVLRRRPTFRTEKGAFFLHVGSFVVVLVAGAVRFWLAPGSEAAAKALGMAAAHGIYSLSFLELWALSEGGYSLRVLEAVFRAPDIPRADIVARFAELSERKKAGRLASLSQMGLVACRGERYEATPRGRGIAAVLAGLTWLAGYKSTG